MTPADFARQAFALVAENDARAAVASLERLAELLAASVPGEKVER